MAKEKERVDLDDRIWAISGTVDPDDYKEPATGMATDQDLVYVKYRPARKSKNAVGRFLGRLFGVLPLLGKVVDADDTRRIPEAIPDNQIDFVYTPNRAPGKDKDQDLAGQPNRKLVLRQDRDGNAAYEDEVKDRESNRINRIEKEKKRSDSNAAIEQAEAIESKSNDESKEKNRGHRSRHDDYYRDQQEVM
jgi:hypothetical protein